MAITSIHIVSIEKQGVMLTINTAEYPDKPFKFDISNHYFYSFTGKHVQNITPCFRKHYIADTVNNDLSEFYRFIADAIISSKSRDNYYYRQAMNYLKIIDMYFTSTDLLDMDNLSDTPTELPKGYLNWLRDNDKKINSKTIKEFKTIQLLTKAPKIVREVVEFCKPNIENMTIQSLISILMDYESRGIDKVTTFCKLFKNSVKKFSWNFLDDVYNFISFTFKGCNIFVRNFNGFTGYLYCIPNWDKYIDVEQDMQLNLQRLKELALVEANKTIKERQERFSAIEEMDFGEYIVKIPYTKEELVLEGNNQHNCVGGYDTYIKSGRDFVYFIRKKDNPDDSYVTCQFAIKDYYREENRNKQTVQALFHYNQYIPKDHSVWDCIRAVDKIAKELYEKSLEVNE